MDGKDQSSGFVKDVLKRALIYALGAAILLALIGQGAWAHGVALGALASALNFLLMAWLLPRAVVANRRRAEVASFLSIALRFAFMGGALALALTKSSFFSPALTAVGLFTVQITILVDRLIGGRLVANTSGSR